MKPEILRTNLLYHVAPFAGREAWRQNLRQLEPRLGQFNGRKLVSIATGEGLEPPAAVQAVLGNRVEYLEVANHPKLRECASYLPLFRTVASVDPGEATFYAHAKGSSRADKLEGCAYWRNLMYHLLLDNPELVRRHLLRKYALVSTHRKNWKVKFSDGGASPWHFAGTFWWFRHDEFFRRSWDVLPAAGWSLEALPGQLFQVGEGCCLAKDGLKDPYDPGQYQGLERIPDIAPVGAAGAFRVEVGGGAAPRGGGYLNVDRWPEADVVLDFEELSGGTCLPFRDASVGWLYSSHCLEHVRGLVPVLREIGRVCREGAEVEIRVPHWASNMALCFDHRHTISPTQVEHWTKTALGYWWHVCPRRLELTSTEFVPNEPILRRWKRLLPAARDQDILELCPDACHENRWKFRVVPNG